MSGKSTLRLKSTVAKKRRGSLEGKRIEAEPQHDEVHAEHLRVSAMFLERMGRQPLQIERQVAQDLTRRAVAAYKQWLPPLLKAWAAHVATEKGFSGANEYVYVVTEKLRDAAPSSDSAINAIDGAMRFHLYDAAKIMEDEYDADDEEETKLSEILAVHYLSPDAAEIKAKYFGMSKRAYWRKVDAAHRLVAENVHEKMREIENNSAPQSSGTLQTL
jgi:hypothetical protein